MRQIFRQELQQVGDGLVTMARLVATGMEKASTALRTADLTLAEEVIDGDRRVDELERRLDDQCVSLLVLQAPVATDLRVVVSALRLIATLERMGDLARHVALVARGRYPNVAVDGRMRHLVERMGTQATDVAGLVVRLLDNHDLTLAAQIERDDNILDDLHRETFSVLLDESNHASRQQLVDSVLLSRYLERFGDHAVSVAQRITYLVTGDNERAAQDLPIDDADSPL